MKNIEKTKVIVQTIVDVNISKVWELWTIPEHIMKWNNASEDWCTPKAENDLQEGGKFLYRMEAKDGSMGFDFWGIYDSVKENELIEYTLGDDRKVRIEFSFRNGKTEIVETFEVEDTNSIEMQRNGWQSILNNFKKYAEVNKNYIV